MKQQFGIAKGGRANSSQNIKGSLSAADEDDDLNFENVNIDCKAREGEQERKDRMWGGFSEAHGGFISLVYKQENVMIIIIVINENVTL